jgi:hypothetical protein
MYIESVLSYITFKALCTAEIVMHTIKESEYIYFCALLYIAHTKKCLKWVMDLNVIETTRVQLVGIVYETHFMKSDAWHSLSV